MVTKWKRTDPWASVLPSRWPWFGCSASATISLPRVSNYFLYNIICNHPISVLLTVRPQKEDTTHSGSYVACSLTYLLAMVSTNMAMRWVPYPTAVVGKSAKPIPVMILGVLIGRKSYSFTRYACVLTIVVGVILFMYKEGKVSNLPAETTLLGEVLLFLSLSMDGLTGAVQERIRAASSPSGQQMMRAMNFWSTLMLGFAMLFTGMFCDFNL